MLNTYSKIKKEVATSLQHRAQLIVIFLSPLWAYILTEILRLINFLDINKYNGWQFNEIACSRDVAKRLNVVYVEYWHFPTLDAWIIFTFSFFILGLAIALRTNWANSACKLSLLISVLLILAGTFGLSSLIAPKGEQNPFFVFNLISLLIVFIVFVVRGYDILTWRTRVRLIAPIFGGYISGLLISFFIYTILLDLNLLPAIAYCQVN